MVRLGHWSGVPYWHKGSATEAARTSVVWACSVGAAEIATRCLAFNHASPRVLEMCGLRLEGTLRSHMVRDGARHDVACFGALREEF